LRNWMQVLVSMVMNVQNLWKAENFLTCWGRFSISAKIVLCSAWCRANKYPGG
jgi:hypothetical protein